MRPFSIWSLDQELCKQSKFKSSFYWQSLAQTQIYLGYAFTKSAGFCLNMIDNKCQLS